MKEAQKPTKLHGDKAENPKNDRGFYQTRVQPTPSDDAGEDCSSKHRAAVAIMNDR